MTEPKKRTAKDRVLQNAHQNVPVDLALFSFLEAELLRNTLAKKGKLKHHWPLWSEIEKEQPDVKIEAWPRYVEQYLDWFTAENPILQENGEYTREKLGYTAVKLAELTQTISTLHITCFEQELPPFQSGVPVWEHLQKCITSKIPAAGPYINAFFEWTFKPLQEESFVPGSRPPVGRFAPPSMRKFDQKPRRSDGYKDSRKDYKKEFSQEPKASAPTHSPPQDVKDEQETLAENPKPFRGKARDASHKHSSEGRPRAPKFEKRPTFNHKVEGDRSRKDPDETKRLTKIHLEEAEEAISRMKTNPDLPEIQLAPANSYYRRLQHQKIVDAGFLSHSQGEGADRHVCISRTASSDGSQPQ